MWRPSASMVCGTPSCNSRSWNIYLPRTSHTNVAFFPKCSYFLYISDTMVPPLSDHQRHSLLCSLVERNPSGNVCGGVSLTAGVSAGCVDPVGRELLWASTYYCPGRLKVKREWCSLGPADYRGTGTFSSWLAGFKSVGFAEQGSIG